jgi:glycosyltransferase involved in cell wall biosynthesis
MHISVVTETFPPEINGVANTLWQMVRGLMLRGHSITLVRPATSEKSRRANRGVAEVLTPGLPLPGYPGLRFGLPAGRRIRRVWTDRRPHAVYIATEGPLGRSALAVARALGIPALTGMHTNFHEYSRHYGVGLLSPFIRGYLRRFHNNSQGTLTPTREAAEELRRNGFEKISVWPRGVDANLFSPARRSAALRQTWGAGEDTPVVLYVGRIAPEKNIDLAVRAYEHLSAERPETRFVLVGDGPATERLRKRCPQAVFTGPKRGEELAAHYASGDVFLFPSLTETFGNVVLEAMASGLAVLAYDTAAARELITDAANGAKVPPGDEQAFVARALALVAQATHRQALGKAAGASALEYDWPRIIARLEEMLAGLSRQALLPGEATA